MHIIFKKGSKVGSITPSSKFLAKKMLENIDFSKDIVIAEFGPGTGVFTEMIIKKMTQNSKLYVFELNPEFIFNLEDKITTNKDVRFICDSASSIKKHLKNEEINEVDYIVSSLPFSLFDDELKEEILESSYDVLKKGGVMTQFQYTEQCKSLFTKYFGKIKVKFTFKHL